MSSATMTVRLNSRLKTRLEKLAKVIDRSKSFLAAEAIDEYLKVHEWQIQEIQKGILEAEAGELVDHQQIVQYWRKKRANKMDKKRRTKSRTG